jgi:glycosyltransferase involved in cell wall biosynthesis
MSTALANEYRCRAPIVLYNAFRWSDRKTIDGLYKDRMNLRTPSIHWFSQTLGPGRGLEDLFAALPKLEHQIEIHLRGVQTADFSAWIRNRVPPQWKHRIFLHPLVSNDELLSRIAEHDIGFAGEMKYCRSRDLTVTNKILHYLLGGLAVVASDTLGQQEIAHSAPGATLTYRSGNAVELAECLNSLIRDFRQLQKAKAAALQAAETVFSWEHQEPLLIQTVSSALQSVGC